MVDLFKRKRFESPTLRDAPRIELCVMPDCWAPAVGVCHLPSAEIGFHAGTGQKTHDWLGAHLCQSHHDYADGAAGRHDHRFRMQALALTVQRLFDRGVIIVQGEDHTVNLPF